MVLCCLTVIVLGAGMTVSQERSTECSVPRMQDDRNDRHARSTMRCSPASWNCYDCPERRRESFDLSLQAVKLVSASRNPIRSPEAQPSGTIVAQS